MVFFFNLTTRNTSENTWKSLPIPRRLDSFHLIGEITLSYQSFHQGDTIGGPLVAFVLLEGETIKGLFLWRKSNEIRWNIARTDFQRELQQLRAINLQTVQRLWSTHHALQQHWTPLSNHKNSTLISLLFILQERRFPTTSKIYFTDIFAMCSENAIIWSNISHTGIIFCKILLVKIEFLNCELYKSFIILKVHIQNHF
jgi:hypothetical protein